MPRDSKGKAKIPAGHFNKEGTSQGKPTGAVRPQPDASNEHAGKKREPNYDRKRH